MTTELEERVMKGIEFFDLDYPEILRSIDLDTLDMRNQSQCVLGQAYGHYDDGLYELDMTLEEAVEFGLDTWTTEKYNPEDLTPIWKTKIVEWRSEHISVSSGFAVEL